MSRLLPKFAFVLCAALCGALFIVPAFAQSGVANQIPTIIVRTGEHPTFDRVVFDAPRGARYTLKNDKGLVTVQFSLAAKLHLTPTKLTRVKQLSVVSGADGQSPLSVSFRTADKATLKDFMSGPSVVIDVMGSAVPDVVLAKEEKTKQPDAAPTPDKIKEEPKPVSPEVAAQDATKAVDQAAVQPSADVPANDNASTQDAALAESAAASQTEGAVGGEDAQQGVVPTDEVVTQQDNTNEDEQKKPILNWPPANTGMDEKTKEAINAMVQESPPVPVAVLDPKLEIGTAIFARAGYVTILFDRKLVGDSLVSSPPPRVKLEPLNLLRHTGFRIAIPDHVSVRATRRGTAWEIYLIEAKDAPPISTEFVAQPNFALGARLLIPTPTPLEPLVMKDPIVGDDLIIIPMQETAAFAIKKRLSDFQIVPAAQGLVIKPWHEKITARIVPDGIEVSSEGGLKLSPLNDTGAKAKGKGKIADKLVYDLDRWRGRPEDGFTKTRHKLMQTIVDVSPDERVLARLDLARFYFAHGFGQEALALLSIIVKELPEIEIYPEYLSLRGGAKLLAGQVQTGLADLDGPAFKEQKDIALWRAMGAALIQDWIKADELFARSADLLASYPEPFRTRFILLATEAALAKDNDKQASQWLRLLEDKEMTEQTRAALDYLQGVIQSKAGHAEASEKLWKSVAQGKDRLYKIRAELALVDLGIATKSMTPKQAVDRLEGLRFSWRGDDLEFDILKRLCGYYMEAKDFKSGFSVLQKALRLFPSTELSAALRNDMVRSFQDVFLTELGKDLSPIDALSLYTEHKALVPSGEEGNAVRRNLAERLVDVDLLDLAADLLEEVIKNSSKPEEKARTVTRLAGIKLLDHNAADAIALLDKNQADVATLAQDIKDERQLLRARALSEQGKYQDALAALPAGVAKSTLLLRADMALRAKNWSDASRALMTLVESTKVGATPTKEQSEWLLHTAIAMAQTGDSSGLDALEKNYGKAMDQTQLGNLFHVLTRPEKMTQMKDIYAAQSKLSEVDMFKGVLDGYRKDKKN